MKTNWRIQWFAAHWNYACRNGCVHSIMELRFFQGQMIELLEEALTRPFKRE